MVGTQLYFHIYVAELSEGFGNPDVERYIPALEDVEDHVYCG